MLSVLSLVCGFAAVQKVETNFACNIRDVFSTIYTENAILTRQHMLDNS